MNQLLLAAAHHIRFEWHIIIYQKIVIVLKICHISKESTYVSISITLSVVQYLLGMSKLRWSTILSLFCFFFFFFNLCHDLLSLCVVFRDFWTEQLMLSVSHVLMLAFASSDVQLVGLLAILLVQPVPPAALCMSMCTATRIEVFVLAQLKLANCWLEGLFDGCTLD